MGVSHTGQNPGLAGELDNVVIVRARELSDRAVFAWRAALCLI